MSNDFEQIQEVVDPQKRRIIYVHSEIVQQILKLGFPDTVPQHFTTILTKPDSIWMDTRNGVHCYEKHMGGRKYIVSTLEVEELGGRFFIINSWFDERDKTLVTLQQFVKAVDDKKLKEKMSQKISDSKSWMKILYEDTSYLKTSKYQKRGINVIEKSGKKVVEVSSKKK